MGHNQVTKNVLDNILNQIQVELKQPKKPVEFFFTTYRRIYHIFSRTERESMQNWTTFTGTEKGIWLFKNIVGNGWKNYVTLFIEKNQK